VAENGALLSYPNRGETVLLGESPLQSLIEALEQRQVKPLKVGRGIVSTLIPHDITAIKAIEELGLSWQISYNKGAVMILAEGVDKNSGLKFALKQMNLNAAEVVGVGDAENDLPLLELCGLSVAVNNALPILKENSDWVMTKNRGEGVVELIDRLI
jgi:HAD superfamily hydrolase (TIGR01484 family)